MADVDVFMYRKHTVRSNIADPVIFHARHAVQGCVQGAGQQDAGQNWQWYRSRKALIILTPSCLSQVVTPEQWVYKSSWKRHLPDFTW